MTQDEKGYTFDFGLRGKVQDIFSFDSSVFALIYKDRIGFVHETKFITPEGKPASSKISIIILA